MILLGVVHTPTQLTGFLVTVFTGQPFAIPAVCALVVPPLHVPFVHTPSKLTQFPIVGEHFAIPAVNALVALELVCVVLTTIALEKP